MPATPRPPTEGHAWVFSSHLRHHVRHLAASTGVPWRVIALLAGVPSGTVSAIIGPTGRPRARIREVDARQLLNLTSEAILAAQRTTVPVTPTVHRIEALEGAGHGRSQIAHYLNVSQAELDLLTSGRLVTCTLMVRVRAQAACEAHGLWWSEPDSTRGT